MIRNLFPAAALLAALFLPIRGPAPAAVPLDHLPALAGDYFPIRSRATGTDYHIYVRLPAGYATSGDRTYPIVYLTDGDSLFPMLAPTHLMMTYDDAIPDAILVGIAYGSFDPAINRRHVDFTEASFGAPDGAAAFHSFLRDELLPEVERRYRADRERRILFGQSRGGYLILYSAYAEPDLFWGRIASNPSFVPGRERLFGPTPRASRRDLGLPVISGADRPRSREPAMEWFAAMEGRTDLPWALHARHLEGGTHAADAARAYRAGMRWLFGLDRD